MNAGTCEAENGGCEDVCVDTVHGPQCSCSPGLILNQTDLSTCIGEKFLPHSPHRKAIDYNGFNRLK